MDKKKYTDETTQIKVIKKGKKNIINEDENEYQDLQKTREFKKVFVLNGKVVDRYHPVIKKGLSEEQVQSRVKEGLSNKYRDKNQKTYIGIVLKNIFTFLNILLFIIGAVLISIGIIYHKETGYYFNLIFLGVITANLIIGIVQECQAKKKIDKLSVLNKINATIIRNGIQYEVPIDELVLDDTLVLNNGNKITADAIIKEGIIEVNESLLTGESLPVKKGPGDPIYAGSFVSSGSCLARIERVGKEMYVSKLEQNVKKLKKNNSQILSALNKIIRWISYVIIPLGAILFLVSYAAETDLFKTQLVGEPLGNLISSVAGSMVAMIPSGLYLTVSVTLFVTMGRLASKKALVQDSYSVESLARVDTLCLDKTGTITDGTMVVEEEVKYVDSFDSSNLIANLVNAFPNKNQTAVALDKKYKVNEKLNVVKTLPFSSSRKKSGVKFEGVGAFVLGAPEFILNPEDSLVKELEKYTIQGYRVVLMAKVDDLTDDDVVGKPLPLSAFVIKDHIRDTAASTIAWFKENGVDVKIISGDNPITVSAIAKEVGVDNADQYISLEGLSIDEVEEAAKKYTVFGRVAPEQKASLVKSLKEMGRTVAMTGDGVNDILAMKQADCSIAMGSGSDASRNVAQLVLMDDNFASLPNVVREGRRVINNIQSVASLFLMKTIFAIILTALSIVVRSKYPFEPRNMNVFEVCAIGLPAFFLALQPNTALVKGSFLKNVFNKCLPAAIVLLLSIITPLGLTGWFGGGGVWGLNISNTGAYAGMTLLLTGLVILGVHCLPFNKYRLCVYLLMWGLSLIGVYVFSLFSDVTGFDIYHQNSNIYYVCLIGLVVGIIAYAISYFFFSLIYNKEFRTKVNKYIRGKKGKQ